MTKGVGFLPLLVLLPWLLVRAKSRQTLPRHRGRHALAGIAGFLAGIGVWLGPMLATTLASNDPALAGYAHEMLFKQTGQRYAAPWMHVKPAWYYLQTMLMLWAPGSLLAPWLLPAWWRRIRRMDARYTLLLGWSLLVLVFFSASPGKREVYVFPMLPALCVAAAPLLPGLLKRAGVRAVLWSYMGALTIAAAALGAWLLGAPAERLQGITEGRGMGIGTLEHLGVWLLTLASTTLAVMVAAWWRLRDQPAIALVVVTAGLWTAYGIGFMPALSPDASAQAVMQRVGRHIGPDAELAMLGWREQHLLQADRPTVDFGFKRAFAEQWPDAEAWLLGAPKQRWLFLTDDAIVPCLDPAMLIDVGDSNRRSWVLAPGSAWIDGCHVPSSPSAQAGR